MALLTIIILLSNDSHEYWIGFFQCREDIILVEIYFGKNLNEIQI